MTSSRFEHVVTNADVVGDHLTLGYDADGEFFATAEGDTDDYEHRVLGSSLVDVAREDDAESTFELSYLKTLAEAMPEGVDVTLELDEEWPMVVRYDIGPDGEGSVCYCIAPRIRRD